MDELEVIDMLNEQQIDAIISGSPEAYYERMKPNAARPHNISNSLWRLGIWNEDGTPTSFGESVASLLKDSQ